MKVIIVVAVWLALSLFAGVGLAALGAGTMALPWVLGSAGFMALFFSPVLLALDGEVVSVPYMSVSPDQLSSAGAFVAREWGDYGYRFTGIESPTGAVSVFTVRHSDGSEFAIAADKWGNCEQLPDDVESRAAQIRVMHANATQP